MKHIFVTDYFQHGIFQTDDEDYFVEPLWNDTSTDSGRGHPHVVYKRSSMQFPNDNVHCGVTGLYLITVGIYSMNTIH